MSDETDTTSEVARVLLLHASFKASQGIQEPDAPWWWECDGCDTKVARGGTGRNDTFSGLAAHQAAMLAEAGLLRDHATIDALNQRCQILVDEADGLRAQIATQEPAGATQGGSGDSRASGGSCARCGTGITLPANDPENREMAVCAPCGITVLKEGYRTARAQVEAIRAAITREAAHGEAITRCNLVAERFQAVLDSVTVP